MSDNEEEEKNMETIIEELMEEEILEKIVNTEDPDSFHPITPMNLSYPTPNLNHIQSDNYEPLDHIIIYDNEISESSETSHETTSETTHTQEFSPDELNYYLANNSPPLINNYNSDNDSYISDAPSLPDLSDISRNSNRAAQIYPYLSSVLPSLPLLPSLLLPSLNLPQPSFDISYDIHESLLHSTFHDKAKYKRIISNKEMKNLKYIKYSKTLDINHECPILKIDFTEDMDIIKLPCNHCFEPTAITKWLQEENSVCPVCRLEFESVEVDNTPDTETPFTSTSTTSTSTTSTSTTPTSITNTPLYSTIMDLFNRAIEEQNEEDLQFAIINSLQAGELGELETEELETEELEELGEIEEVD